MTDLRKKQNEIMSEVNNSFMGGLDPIDVTGVGLPQIKIAQSTSKVVENGVCDAGDYFLLGDIENVFKSKDDKVKLKIFGMRKVWQEFYNQGDKFENEIFNTVPFVRGGNDSLPKDFNYKGRDCHRARAFEVYLSLIDDLKSNKKRPYLLVLKGYSFSEGQKLTRHFHKMLVKVQEDKNNPTPLSQVFTLGSEKVEFTTKDGKKRSGWAVVLDPCEIEDKGNDMLREHMSLIPKLSDVKDLELEKDVSQKPPSMVEGETISDEF